MNRIIIAFLFVSLVIPQLFSQNLHRDVAMYRVGRNQYFVDMEHQFADIDSSRAVSGITEQKLKKYVISRRNNTRSVSGTERRLFDSAGRRIAVIYYNHRNEEKAREEFSFQGSLMTRHSILIRGKEAYVSQWKYDSARHMLHYSFAKHGRIETVRHWNYSNGKIQNIWIYGHDTTRPEQLYTYAYDNDTGRLLRTTVTDNKGSVKFVWDYSCNDAGHLSKKEAKKESRICQSHVDLPDGGTQEVWQMESHGESYRYIYVYDSLHRMTRFTTFGGKWGDKLYHQYDYTYFGDTTSAIYSSFDKKTGKLIWNRKELLTSGNIVLSEVNTRFKKNGRLQNSWEEQYVYEQSLLKSKSTINLKHRSASRVTEYEYTYRVRE